jgi:vacuolar protein sorting-associated protein 53
MMNIEISE